MEDDVIGLTKHFIQIKTTLAISICFHSPVVFWMENSIFTSLLETAFAGWCAILSLFLLISK